MTDSFQHSEKNPQISSEIRSFFEEAGIDIDDLIAELPEELTEGVLDGDIKQVMNLLRTIERNSNQHKIIFGAALLELRNQVKTNQKELADIKRMLDRFQKDQKREMDSRFKSLESKVDSSRSLLDAIKNFLVRR